MPYQLSVGISNLSLYFLFTGAAGFIGYHLSERLLSLGYHIICLDNINVYYDISLKEARLENLEKHSHFQMYRVGLEDRSAVEDLFSNHHNGIEGGINMALTYVLWLIWQNEQSRQRYHIGTLEHCDGNLTFILLDGDIMMEKRL